MSSNNSVPVPRTAVPLGIEDPVEAARAELKAALSAIEEKVNVPKRTARAIDRAKVAARRSPGKAIAVAVGVAAAVGVTVWLVVRNRS